MGNFRREGKKPGGGFNRGFGGGKRFSGRDGGKPVKHKAVCGGCGVSCEVPFRPTGGRPVFCDNCFKNQGNDGGRSNKFGGERRGRFDSADKQKYDAVCAKCGKDCQVPFRPTVGKPVLCDSCFKQDGSGGKDSGKIMEQINLLNEKIDKLMEILTSKALTEKNKKPKVKKELTKKKIAKEKKEKKEKPKQKLPQKKTSKKKK